MPPLDVIYEDGPCLVVNKPAGLLTQAPRGIDSLEIWVREYYRTREEIEGNFYLGLVHRLDRPVTGAIAFGRNARATQRMAKQFQDRTVEKTYWALVEGDALPDEGVWRDHLHKRHGMAQAIVVPEDDPRGKHAVLRYRVRWRGEVAPHGPVSWLEIELETGRTHQIRVQASSRGHAVLGDTQYGAACPFGPMPEDPREAPIGLHARRLSMRHPMEDKPVDVTAPLGGPWRTVATGGGAPEELAAALRTND